MTKMSMMSQGAEPLLPKSSPLSFHTWSHMTKSALYSDVPKMYGGICKPWQKPSRSTKSLESTCDTMIQWVESYQTSAPEVHCKNRGYKPKKLDARAKNPSHTLGDLPGLPENTSNTKIQWEECHQASLPWGCWKNWGYKPQKVDVLDSKHVCTTSKLPESLGGLFTMENQFSECHQAPALPIHWHYWGQRPQNDNTFICNQLPYWSSILTSTSTLSFEEAEPHKGSLSMLNSSEKGQSCTQEPPALYIHSTEMTKMPPTLKEAEPLPSKSSPLSSFTDNKVWGSGVTLTNHRQSVKKTPTKSGPWNSMSSHLWTTDPIGLSTRG
jgi:hypothetical protein